ncbi:MAG: hypothetical protein LBT15_04745, partial [Synergistaceae bacterium]|nr:hypothetical protein [Synergistaceae bacterium]
GFEEAQTLVDTYNATGVIYRKVDENTSRERAVADHVVGQYWDMKAQKYVNTKNFDIVYDEDGVWIYPVKGKKPGRKTE